RHTPGLRDISTTPTRRGGARDMIDTSISQRAHVRLERRVAEHVCARAQVGMLGPTSRSSTLTAVECAVCRALSRAWMSAFFGTVPGSMRYGAGPLDWAGAPRLRFAEAQ